MEIKIPKGFKVGHYNDDKTGITAILCEKGCIAGCEVRGGAPGTRETDLLRTEKSAKEIHAVVLTGGSAFGLESSCGVMEYLKEKGVGVKVGNKRVPIVCSAVIYDLIYDDYYWPNKEYGKRACERASDKCIEFGQVGVGKGATVGKIRGIKNACKGGVGASTVKIAGVTLTAIVAVNALGDVVDSARGKIIAGAKGRNGEFINTEQCILNGELLKLLTGNTTIGCIITDANLSKSECNKLACAGQNGLARSIYPVQTDYDGDTIFVMARGRKPVINFAMLQTGASKAVELAVINAVKDSVSYTIEATEEREEEQE